MDCDSRPFLFFLPFHFLSLLLCLFCGLAIRLQPYTVVDIKFFGGLIEVDLCLERAVFTLLYMVFNVPAIGRTQSVVVRLKVRPPDYASYDALQLSTTEVHAQWFLLAISEALPESWKLKFESFEFFFCLLIYRGICTDNSLFSLLISEVDCA